MGNLFFDKAHMSPMLSNLKYYADCQHRGLVRDPTRRRWWIKELFVRCVSCRSQRDRRPNTWRPKQNGHYISNGSFQCIFLKIILIWISLGCGIGDPIGYFSAMVQVMAWRRIYVAIFPEPRWLRSSMQYRVIKPGWVNDFRTLWAKRSRLI